MYMQNIHCTCSIGTLQVAKLIVSGKYNYLPIIPPTSKRVESQSDSGPVRPGSKRKEVFDILINTRLQARWSDVSVYKTLSYCCISPNYMHYYYYYFNNRDNETLNKSVYKTLCYCCLYFSNSIYMYKTMCTILKIHYNLNPHNSGVL